MSDGWGFPFRKQCSRGVRGGIDRISLKKGNVQARGPNVSGRDQLQDDADASSRITSEPPKAQPRTPHRASPRA